ncbi:hypothetical protein TNCV_4695921 [Trichonephila clavipes]|nr:hypothetical protein TNCV_4695921 [Trichonephila clavipes]
MDSPNPPLPAQYARLPWKGLSCPSKRGAPHSLRNTGLSKIPMETLEMLSQVYGESNMVRSKIYERHR